MKISVIFSTYNEPAWLEKVLWGFFSQTHKPFEIIIADDGSSDETRSLVEKMGYRSPIKLHHVWQEDAGFQKCRILNKAIAKSKGDYLIFTDGDCIPRADFVFQHVCNSERGFFLSGGYFKLPMSISEQISEDDVISQRVFDISWLHQQGLQYSVKTLKLLSSPYLCKILNRISPARATWNGHNASCHKEFIVAVNGFDERMQYGGEDREFGDRLLNYGLKAKRIRYLAICLHLDHSRGYVTDEMLRRNMEIRNTTLREKVVRAKLGLDNHL